MRGTFAHPQLKNFLAPKSQGAVTRYFPVGEEMSIFDASQKYLAHRVPLLVIAGKDYGMGSSRDWAAKGVYMLGVKAVIFESVERIHRSNLIGMGILPLEFMNGENPVSLGLDGSESFSINGLDDTMVPGQVFHVCAQQADGSNVFFQVRSRIDTRIEVEYHKHGGILPYVFRNAVCEG